MQTNVNTTATLITKQDGIPKLQKISINPSALDVLDTEEIVSQKDTDVEICDMQERYVEEILRKNGYKFQDECNWTDISDDLWYDVAIALDGWRRIGCAVEHVIGANGTEYWHASDALYMSDSDSGISYDYYFSYCPDEFDIIDAICIENDISQDEDKISQLILSKCRGCIKALGQTEDKD